MIGSEVLDHALIVPPNGRQATAPGSARRAGVYDATGAIVPASVLLRRQKPVRLFAVEADAPAGPALEDEACFCGHWAPNFGHFLLESLSRAWFFRSRPELTLCWITARETITGWQRALLDIIGVTNRIRLIVQPTRVRRLHVPEPGYRIHAFFRPEQVAALAVRPATSPRPGKRVWLSRSGLADKTIVNEPEIEARLAPDWIIYRPEAHPVPEQLAMLADAERIAGFMGSAMHSFVLFEQLAVRVDLFCRAGTLNENYSLIAEAKGIDQHVHTPEMEMLPGPRGTLRTRLIDGNAVEAVLRASG